MLGTPDLPRSPWTARATSCLMNHRLMLSGSHPEPSSCRIQAGAELGRGVGPQGRRTIGSSGPGQTGITIDLEAPMGSGDGWMGSGRPAGEVAYDPGNGPPQAGGTVIELETALRLCRQVQDEVRGKGGAVPGGSAEAAAGSAAAIQQRCPWPPRLVSRVRAGQSAPGRQHVPRRRAGPTEVTVVATTAKERPLNGRVGRPLSHPDWT
jgi:hypothetical protein